MDIDIREIEPRDYTAVASLWNNEIGNRMATEENIGGFYGKVRGDDRYIGGAPEWIATLESEEIE